MLAESVAEKEFVSTINARTCATNAEGLKFAGTADDAAYAKIVAEPIFVNTEGSETSVKIVRE
jgi:hypothetical protein